MRRLLLSLMAGIRRMNTAWRLSRCSAPKRRFGSDLHIGARTRFWAPDSVEIGDHTYIGKDVHVETNCQIGRHVLIANRVGLVGRRDHDFRTVGVPVRFGHWIGSQRSPSPFRTTTRRSTPVTATRSTRASRTTRGRSRTWSRCRSSPADPRREWRWWRRRYPRQRRQRSTAPSRAMTRQLSARKPPPTRP